MVASRSNVDLNYHTPASEGAHSPLLPVAYATDTMREATLHRPYPGQYAPVQQHTPPQQYPPQQQYFQQQRTMSPGPMQAYARTPSPGPQAAYGQAQGGEYFGHGQYPSQSGTNSPRMSPDSYASHPPVPPPGLTDDGAPNMAGRGAHRAQ